MNCYAKLSFWAEAHNEGEKAEWDEFLPLVKGTVCEALGYVEVMSSLDDLKERTVVAAFAAVLSEGFARMNELFWREFSSLPKKEILSWRDFFRGEVLTASKEEIEGAISSLSVIKLVLA